MKRVNIISLLLAGCFSLPVAAFAQDENEKVIFQAMEDELQRNAKELQLADFDKPFFLSYALSASERFEISASLGAVKNAFHLPMGALGTVRLMLGDNHRTSDGRYQGEFGRVGMPIDGDYNLIRRNFWLATDMAYKNELRNLTGKQAYLKANPKSAEEEMLDDFAKLEVPTTTIVASPKFEFDFEKWKGNVRELSGIFKAYKDVFNSSVSVSVMQGTLYKKTSEGVTVRQPMSYVIVRANGAVRTSERVTFGDTYSCVAALPQDLPAMEELKKQVTDFADNLVKLRVAEPITEFYSGPILFENSASANIFVSNLLRPGALMAWRKPEGEKPAMTLDSRMGKKVVDSRITMKNYSTLEKYNNTKLLGAYQVDAEGVVPEKEVTLIENGILKRQLNGRVPTLKVPGSTGSSRFSFADNTIVFSTAPGTIHILVNDGTKQEKMKKALLKAAKEEGLDYAYIVRKMSGQSSMIYKVEVKDGSETLVRSGDFSPINLSKIKRIRNVSSTEKVLNYYSANLIPSSLIYPSSILVEDVEIGKSDLKKEKAPALVFPLQRE